jgi:NAD(P)-dependent dehydrogenase (short-subunit alcohol dehydrogenase family)
MMAANAEPLLNMVRCVVPGMLQRRHGKIVTIGAPVGNKGQALIGSYSASKGAVIRLTEAMAAELGPHGINVNCILPGTIDTPTNRTSMPDEDFSSWIAPAAIADVIGFLSSQDADAVNGAALPVTGLGG